jgi:NitT/TauT family transport system ATP-binding protein
MPGDVLEVRIASKTYRSGTGPGRHVLRDIAFSASPGSVLALFGPSGTGKTTTLRIVTGLDTEFSGRVKRSSSRLGVMFQEPNLAPWLTVEDNLRLVVTEGVPDPDIPAILEEVGVAGSGKSLPRQLSLGMARRVAFARALAVSPGVLILDEPFASLDRQAAGGLAAVIRRRADDTGATVLLATHDLGHVLPIADRILILFGQPATLVADVAVPSRMDAAARMQFRGELLARFPFLGTIEENAPSGQVVIGPAAPPDEG